MTGKAAESKGSDPQGPGLCSRPPSGTQGPGGPQSAVRSPASGLLQPLGLRLAACKVKILFIDVENCLTIECFCY